MKMTELRKKSAKDLRALLDKNAAKIAKAAQEQRSGEASNVCERRNLRRTNARIKTLLNEQPGEEK